MIANKARPLRLIMILVPTVLIMLTVSTSIGAVLCVDSDMATSGDGTCWSSPYKYIQEAVDAASV